MDNVVETQSFALVSSGTHLDHKKHVPNDSGVVVFHTSLGFLVRQYAAAARKNHVNQDGSVNMLLDVWNKAEGADSKLANRLEFYHLNSRDLKYVTNIFIAGTLTKAMVKQLEYEYNHTDKNRLDKKTVLMMGSYLDRDVVQFDDKNDQIANLRLKYLVWSLNGKTPIISSFNHDNLVERPVSYNGSRQLKNWVADPSGSLALRTTLSFLSNYQKSRFQNFKVIKTKDGKSFCPAVLGEWAISDLPLDFISTFNDKMIAVLKRADILRVSYTFNESSKRTAEEILALRQQKTNDKILIFAGAVKPIASVDNKSFNAFINKQGKKIVELRVTRGTFYTERNL